MIVKKSLLVLCFALLSASSGSAQLLLSSFGGTETIDFTGFTGAGFASSPAAGQLDSDAWLVTGFNQAADLSRGASSGGVTTGGVYAFDVSNGGTANPALGVQPTGSDFTPGSFTLVLQNNTGSTLDSVSISYNIFLLNNEGRANSFNFSYSTDNSSYTVVDSENFISTGAADVSPVWNATSKGATLSDLDIAAGSNLWVRWTGNDTPSGGSRDEFALDDVSVSAIPEPSTYALLFGGLMLSVVMWKRRYR